MVDQNRALLHGTLIFDERQIGSVHLGRPGVVEGQGKPVALDGKVELFDAPAVLQVEHVFRFSLDDLHAPLDAEKGIEDRTQEDQQDAGVDEVHAVGG